MITNTQQPKDIPPETRRRIEQYRRERDQLISRAVTFPELRKRVAFVARDRLARLIAARRDEGNWPPPGDWPEFDGELVAAMDAANEEEWNDNFHSDTFKAAVALAAKKRAEDYAGKVVARCAQRRDRELQIRRAVFRARARKRFDTADKEH